jgi:hypothetical protein
MDWTRFFLITFHTKESRRMGDRLDDPIGAPGLGKNALEKNGAWEAT